MSEDWTSAERAPVLVRWVVVGLVTAAVFALDFRYVVVHFSHGGDLLDSGWFAWIMASGDPWLTSPRSVSGLSYFNYHLAPYLSVLSVMFHAIGVDRFTALALHQGAMFALFAGSLCALVVQSWAGARSAVLLLAAIVFAVVGDVVLQVASFPHFEIAIPAFCLLGTALWQRGHRAIAAAAFLVACLVREDGGLYAAAFLFGLAALQPVGAATARSAEVLLGAGAVVVSLAMFWIKSRFFPGYPTFSSNFSGEGWAHLNAGFVAQRLIDLALNPHAQTALLTALVLAFVSWRYLVFVVLLSPVIVAQALAVRDQLGHFTAYYATPFVLIWAGLVIVASHRARQGKLRSVEPAVLLVSALLGSGPFLFLVQPPGWFPVAAMAMVTETTDLPRLADDATAATAGLPGACVSNGVAALIPDAFAPAQVIEPKSDLSACRTVFLFNEDLHYAILKPRLAGWATGAVIDGRIERYDQRP